MNDECPITMAELKLRCSGGKPDECWEWRAGFLSNGKRPVITRRIDTPEGRVGKQFYARHLALWLWTGKRPELGVKRAIVDTCENPNCVNPAHLRVVSRKVIVKRTVASGWYETAAYRSKVANGCRRNVKLSDEAVQDIRLSVEPAPIAAARHGVSAAYVYMLRRGEFRKNYSNPFAGLGA